MGWSEVLIKKSSSYVTHNSSHPVGTGGGRVGTGLAVQPRVGYAPSGGLGAILLILLILLLLGII